jgi:hypothetical protein
MVDVPGDVVTRDVASALIASRRSVTPMPEKPHAPWRVAGVLH